MQDRSLYQKLSGSLQDKNHICCLFTSKNEFLSTLKIMKKKPDLLVLDYRTYNHDIFNIYNYLKEISCPVPLIFYNDPFPQNKEARILQWFLVNNLYYANSKIRLENYVSLFTLIANSLGKRLPRNLKTCTVRINEYHDFPPKLYKAFSVLQNQFPNPVSLSKLQNACAQPNPSSMYSILSRLKKFLKKTFGARYEIIKQSGGYLLLTFENENPFS